MTDTYVWTPPGASPEELEEFFALKEGLPVQLREAVIGWIRRSKVDSAGWVKWDFLLEFQTVSKRNHGIPHNQTSRFETLANALRNWEGKHLIWLVDFMLSRPSTGSSLADSLESILSNGGSAFAVGRRNGRNGLVERVPSAVVDIVENVTSLQDRAGRKLSEAWGRAYGVSPDPSGAYASAVKAVEILACPLISPNDKDGTLGKSKSVLRDQPGWTFAIKQPGDDNENNVAPLVAMLELLLRGQRDRHGSEDYSDVTVEEAQSAVLLASTLVGWFAKGMVQRAQ